MTGFSAIGVPRKLRRGTPHFQTDRMMTRLVRMRHSGMMGRRRFRTRGRCNSGNRCGGHGDANRDRTRADPGGSTRTRGSARARSARSRSPLSLSKHLQRNRKCYNQQERNANRVFSEFPHDKLLTRQPSIVG